MMRDELSYCIRQAFRFEPSADQCRAIDVFCDFVADRDDRAAMILRGSAGTGKTSLAGAMVRAMLAFGHKVVLLAPTGRAAKVFSINSGQPAFTIHRKIYRQKSFNGEMPGFDLNVNMHRDTLFIIDEASMIANYGMSEGVFGSGRLLDDLMEYVYSGSNCRLMMIGDKAQLPPVGEEESPALMPEVMESYFLKVYDVGLDEVLRQASESGILWNATVIRMMVANGAEARIPRIRLRGFADICVVPGGELIERIASSYSEVGVDETMIVTRSNKRAGIYNQGIRNTILDREGILATGDMLMVVKNNYFWATEERVGKEHPLASAFIANGDRARVVRVRNCRELYGFRFVDVWLQFPDYDNSELQATLVTDSLLAEAPALTREQSNSLFYSVLEDYQDVRLKSERMKCVRNDPYYNALQVKYAYAVTCHKAQGGQWAHVYIDQGYVAANMTPQDYIHWLYTAFTRATEKLFLVNWPKEGLASDGVTEPAGGLKA